MNEQILIENNKTFGDVFNKWRIKRVRKLEKIFGVDWFKDKKILELGCGYGNIGLYFEALGADVTFSDANEDNLNVLKTKNPNAKIIRIDQDTEWKLNQTYDLIIHFGISYHLNNWENDLITSIKHCKYLAYETAVSKFNDDTEFKIKDIHRLKEQSSFNGIGTLFSAQKIRSILKSLNVEYTRYDDADLNTQIFKYDWDNLYKHNIKEPIIIDSWFNSSYYGGRRFWIIKNNIP